MIDENKTKVKHNRHNYFKQKYDVKHASSNSLMNVTLDRGIILFDIIIFTHLCYTLFDIHKLWISSSFL